MTDTANLFLEVDNLKTYFFLHEGTVKAVDGVSFNLYKGRSLGVIGESGCGKSVTAHSILRLVPSPPGREVDGKILLHLHEGSNGSSTEEIVDTLKLERNGPKMRSIRGKEIGMIFQEPMTSFSPVHTIGSQIMENLLLHTPGISKKEARDRTIEMLQRVGIARAHQQVDAYPHQFSGGMRQRAMIAMALICGPSMLIGDEPTTALDVTIQAQILDLINDLQAELNMALMYISHDLAVVGEMSDEIIVMYLGLVMEHASTDEIFDNPLHPYTLALWRSIPTIEGKLERLTPISGTLPSPFAHIPGCPFFSRCERRIPGTCDAALPPLKEVAPGHWVRCVLY
ncbi:MAG: Oligopeptide transport ATP-binding protein OppD [Chloroflexi bacterium ADurb.Bin325]|nr:MAG: Oligopeptide transport ATP-binding protein OppD [Chloroflexi bacterium ADurb.Bin325]